MPTSTRTFRDLVRRTSVLSVTGVVFLVAAAPSASAMNINVTFDSTIAGLSGNATAAINTAAGTISSLYSDSITANIYFQAFNGRGSAAGANASSQWTNNYYSNPTSPSTITASTYKGWLGADATAHPGNTTLATAVQNFGSGNGGTGNQNKKMLVNSANLRALGQSEAFGYYLSAFPGTVIDKNSFIFGALGESAIKIDLVNGGYDGIVYLDNGLNYGAGGWGDSVIYHEISEVLGIGGAGSQLTLGGSSLEVLGPMDLYRYSGAGQPSSNPLSNAAAPYFSVDGGASAIAYFNNSGSGDYGDLTTSPCTTQSFSFCANPHAYDTSSTEYQMMMAIGYDPAVAVVPLPASLTLFASSLGLIGLFLACAARRRSPPTPHRPSWCTTLVSTLVHPQRQTTITC